MIKVISCGDCVELGSYKKHSEFSKAINYTRVDRPQNFLVSFVLPSIGNGPFNLVVYNFAGLENSCIELDSTIFQNETYNSTLNNIHFKIGPTFLKAMILDMYLDQSPLVFLLENQSSERETRGSFDLAFRDHFQKGVNLIFSGALREGVMKIRGTGIGLTPSGDDYLCGMMIAIHFLNLNQRQNQFNLDKITNEIYSVAKGDNLISNSALYAAKAGRVSGIFNEFLESLSSGDITKVKEKMDAVVSTGHSSGLDMLIGFIMAIEREVQ